jgi:hypothetical protein
LPWNGDLRHLEYDIASAAHHLRADLDQLFPSSSSATSLDRLWRRQHPQEITEIVGERMKLEADGVGRERPARQPRPLDRAIAFLDPLLCRAALVVEGDDPRGRA